MNTASKIINIFVTQSTLVGFFAVVALIFSKKANFAQFEGNHCAFLFILTYNSEILCKFAAREPAKPLNDAQMCGSFLF